MPVPSANRGFSIGYHPFQRPFAGYDICANGPLRWAALATTDPFLKSKPELGHWQENIGFPEGAGLLSDGPLDACRREGRFLVSASALMSVRQRKRKRAALYDSHLIGDTT
jgi:hypothetical protein